MKNSCRRFKCASLWSSLWGPLHWHMEAYLSLFLISFTAGMVSFGSDTMHIHSHARVRGHTEPPASRKHQQGFSRLLGQFSEWAAKLNLISFFRVIKDQNPSSASPAWCLALHEVHVDFVYARMHGWGEQAILFDHVLLNPITTHALIR